MYQINIIKEKRTKNLCYKMVIKPIYGNTKKEKSKKKNQILESVICWVFYVLNNPAFKFRD